MEAKRIAVFPGSFDPFTKGHANLIDRALPLFDRLVVGIGINGGKRGLFPPEVRKAFIQEVYRDEPRVAVDIFASLTVDYCRKLNARFILRGLRSAIDWEYEKSIAITNRCLDSGIETVFLAADPALECVSSSMVRDILKYRQDVSDFVPEAVAQKLREYQLNY